MNVRVSVEGERGCGYRKVGGIYLMGSGLAEPCERVPWVLEVCPCCGGGIKPSRAPTWINPQELFADDIEPLCDPTIRDHRHSMCPMCKARPEKALLIWVGERHYPFPHDFIKEGAEMGFSRRIRAIPV